MISILMVESTSNMIDVHINVKINRNMTALKNDKQDDHIKTSKEEQIFIQVNKCNLIDIDMSMSILINHTP